MKAKEITVGGKYVAKVSGKLTTVRVDAIRVVPGFTPRADRIYSGRARPDKTVYDVTNLTTGRKLTFRSAARFCGLPLGANKTWIGWASSDPNPHGGYRVGCEEAASDRYRRQDRVNELKAMPSVLAVAVCQADSKKVAQAKFEECWPAAKIAEFIAQRIAGDPSGAFEGRLKHLAERGAAGLITAEEQIVSMMPWFKRNFADAGLIAGCAFPAVASRL